MRRRQSPARAKADPLVPLIDVVFQMIVFFLVAGTLARPLSPDLTLVQTGSLELTQPPDALVLHADGRLTWGGVPATAADYLRETRDAARLVPDREAEAVRVLEVAAELRAAGAQRVVLVAERGLEP